MINQQYQVNANGQQREYYQVAQGVVPGSSGTGSGGRIICRSSRFAKSSTTADGLQTGNRGY